MRAQIALVALATVLTPGLAHAQDDAPATAAPSATPSGEPAKNAETAAPPAEAKPKPPPYSLPWQLRPVRIGTVVRSDTAIAFYKPTGTDSGGTTIASLLAFSYKLTDELAPMVRLGYVTNSPPTVAGGTSTSGSAFMNPVVGGTYAPKLEGPIKVAAFLGAALPFGSGGGNSPDKNAAAALAAGVPARSGMDNAMFAVNYLGIAPGVDVAYIADGLTVQAEATVVQYFRTRGDQSPSSKDSTRTVMTSGLHAGYFVIPQLSLGAELRYQAWLKNPSIPTGLKTRDNLTVAVGPRLHFELGENVWIRPGIAYARGLDNPMSENKYNIVQVDVPVSF